MQRFFGKLTNNNKKEVAEKKKRPIVNEKRNVASTRNNSSRLSANANNTSRLSAQARNNRNNTPSATTTNNNNRQQTNQNNADSDDDDDDDSDDDDDDEDDSDDDDDDDDDSAYGVEQGKYNVTNASADNQTPAAPAAPAASTNKRPRALGGGKFELPRFMIIAIVAVALVIIILAIVLPLTLIKKKEEKKISIMCPDGKQNPRIDCLFDRVDLTAAQANLEAVCKARSCCWSPSPDGGGSTCVFPHNFGFRNYKTKESSFSRYWFELLRLNSPESLARSDISNLEARVEMHSDSRLRLRVKLIFFTYFFFLYS